MQLSIHLKQKTELEYILLKQGQHSLVEIEALPVNSNAVPVRTII